MSRLSSLRTCRTVLDMISVYLPPIRLPVSGASQSGSLCRRLNLRILGYHLSVSGLPYRTPHGPTVFHQVFEGIVFILALMQGVTTFRLGTGNRGSRLIDIVIRCVQSN